VSVLNKRLQTVDKGWSSSLGGGRWAEIHHFKKSTYRVLLHKISAVDECCGNKERKMGTNFEDINGRTMGQCGLDSTGSDVVDVVDAVENLCVP